MRKHTILRLMLNVFGLNAINTSHNNCHSLHSHCCFSFVDISLLQDSDMSKIYGTGTAPTPLFYMYTQLHHILAASAAET